VKSSNSIVNPSVQPILSCQDEPSE